MASFAYPHTMSNASHFSFMWFRRGWILFYHSHPYLLWPGNCLWKGDLFWWHPNVQEASRQQHVKWAQICAQIHEVILITFQHNVSKVSLQKNTLFHNVALKQRKEKLSSWTFKILKTPWNLTKTLYTASYTYMYLSFTIYAILNMISRAKILTTFSHVVLWPCVRKGFPILKSCLIIPPTSHWA